MELRVEDSRRSLLTLDGYPTSPGICAQEQWCSPKNPETPRLLHLNLSVCSGMMGMAGSGGKTLGQECRKNGMAIC
jgi:hypothetical protein